MDTPGVLTNMGAGLENPLCLLVGALKHKVRSCVGVGPGHSVSLCSVSVVLGTCDL